MGGRSWTLVTCANFNNESKLMLQHLSTLLAVKLEGDVEGAGAVCPPHMVVMKAWNWSGDMPKGDPLVDPPAAPLNEDAPGGSKCQRIEAQWRRKSLLIHGCSGRVVSNMAALLMAVPRS